MEEVTNINQMNADEQDRRMKKHIPTAQELQITLHSHIRYQDGNRLNCRGDLIPVEVFGQVSEDAAGNRATSSRFAKNTSTIYNFAFVTLECQDSDCKYPRVVADNPRRVAREKQGKTDWRGRDGKKAASGEKIPF